MHRLRTPRCKVIAFFHNHIRLRSKKMPNMWTWLSAEESMDIARCQFCDIKFGHRITEVLDSFDYEIHNYIQITFHLAHKWSKWVVSKCCCTRDIFANFIWLNENETMVYQLLIKRRYWYHCRVLRRQFANIAIRQVTPSSDVEKEYH